jgi:phosphoribosylaminoimidazole-succinocarboxamide synthase
VCVGWLGPRQACAAYAHKLFEFGQKVAADRGLILVDTKYEFGKDEDGRIIIVDEVHTPDSSRYWIRDTYEARMAAGLEPENIDKEFLRLWFKERCDPYKDAVLPEAPPELVNELSRRYIMLYELITGQDFAFPDAKADANQGLRDALAAYYATN